MKGWRFFVGALLALPLIGCSSTNDLHVSSFYADKNIKDGLLYIRMVESSPGHINGYIAYQVNDNDGDTLKYIYQMYNGTINNRVFSFQTRSSEPLADGPFSSLTLSGNIKRTKLIMYSNANRYSFNKVTDHQLVSDINSLKIAAQHRRLVLRSNKLMTSLGEYGKKLYGSIRSYILFSHDLPAYSNNLKQGYNAYINYYSKCLRYITLENNRGVPHYIWQNCATNVSVNKYQRDRVIHIFEHIEKENRLETGKINDEKNILSEKFNTAMALYKSSCMYRKNAQECLNDEKYLLRIGPFGNVINNTTAIEYAKAKVAANNALSIDKKTVDAGALKLHELAMKISAVNNS
ncbi:hypothetical protein ACJU26_08580 [Acidithiobacillus sp. M4-SHS-6]|uniref:hypothetical protein n=1 Tax=Acidithiobacillus sp. M4-SHS-6 TaxID=3383024 RepID=UPI0039BE0DA8